MCLQLGHSGPPCRLRAHGPVACSCIPSLHWEHQYWKSTKILCKGDRSSAILKHIGRGEEASGHCQGCCRSTLKGSSERSVMPGQGIWGQLSIKYPDIFSSQPLPESSSSHVWNSRTVHGLGVKREEMNHYNFRIIKIKCKEAVPFI